MNVERIEVHLYRILADGPEEDGTFHWESTTWVMMHLRSLGVAGAGLMALTFFDVFRNRKGS